MNKFLNPKKYIDHFIYTLFLPRKSYSQVGEDLILDYFLNTQQKGFYVDVGANHPKRFSNTMFFYKKGWTGINIEPDPVNFHRFVHSRKKDINLNIGIAKESGVLDFYTFRSDTISTFSREAAEKYKSLGYEFLKIKKVRTEPLRNILAQYIPPKTHIDFFSIDTEGFDEIVLASNDWERFRPKLIVLETLEFTEEGKTVKETKETPEAPDNFLALHGYRKIADTYINSIYIDNGFADSLGLR